MALIKNYRELRDYLNTLTDEQLDQKVKTCFEDDVTQEVTVIGPAQENYYAYFGEEALPESEWHEEALKDDDDVVLVLKKGDIYMW